MKNRACPLRNKDLIDGRPSKDLVKEDYLLNLFFGLEILTKLAVSLALILNLESLNVVYTFTMSNFLL